jgi:heme-degrading monooxygenase HmoA
MIARIWHRKTKASDAKAYLEYLFKSGIPAYRATRGNKGAWVLRRMESDVAHFITLSFWESREAIAPLQVPILRSPNTIRRTRSTCSNSSKP